MEAKEYDSTYLIGNVKEHFKSVFRPSRRWDEWRSFYNGWLDGRSKMLVDLLLLKNENIQLKTELKEAKEMIATLNKELKQRIEKDKNF